MNYTAAVDFLLSRTDYERYPGYQYANRFDLRRMDVFLQRLGNPHLNPRTVHIAGSKGKGSTAAMIAAGLCTAGFKTGLYTSPHLITLRERINVNGKSIRKRQLTKVVQIISPHVEAMDTEHKYGGLSTFELLTAVAFMHFHQEGVQYQVLETGLGGRLDATNVVSPNVCVITSISYDHTEVLGNTINKIAEEKAGIIKQGIPVISSPQMNEAATVLINKCKEKNSPLTIVGHDITWKEISSNMSGQNLIVTGRKGAYNLTIPLLGTHQLENAATAVAALELLGLKKNDIETGLSESQWPGRLQILKKRPLIVVDGAHNIDSARRLKEALKKHFHFNKLILIIGTSSDKDLSGIAAELAPLVNFVIATRSRHPRAASATLVAENFARHGVYTEIAENTSLALEKARQTTRHGDLICITGSLFLVGEVIELIKRLKPELYTIKDVGQYRHCI